MPPLPSHVSGTAVLAVFVACLASNALGAAITLSTHLWYPAALRTSTTAALADQQMAGVVMWAVEGMAYVVAAALLFRAWVGGLERLMPARAVTDVKGARA